MHEAQRARKGRHLIQHGRHRHLPVGQIDLEPLLLALRRPDGRDEDAGHGARCARRRGRKEVGGGDSARCRPKLMQQVGCSAVQSTCLCLLRLFVVIEWLAGWSPLHS
jgi:hypothetical protein